MWHFEYSGLENKRQISLESANNVLQELASYLNQEHKKGKIPLIIAGAGISAKHLEGQEKSNDNVQLICYEQGLPSLGEMIQKIHSLLDARQDNSIELKKLKTLFEQTNSTLNNNKQMDLVDREWIGKLFAALSDERDPAACEIWDEFCQWFFFECCIETDTNQNKGGALTINTSKAAQEISHLYSSLDAICLSANFDDFLEYALGGLNGSSRGISLFSKKHVDRYFTRNRRGKKNFSDNPNNRCVLHANGDVLWLHCSGDLDEGYCPNRGKYFPAFYNLKTTNKDEILQCHICGSKMVPTMTMPGTYQKDYNTRQIISSIWKHLAPKISCVITVGLSCNWDDVLLKFIIGLLIECDIPHLDINDFSDPTYTGDTAIVKQIVQEKRFQSCCIKSDATDGLKKLNQIINNIQTQQSTLAENEEESKTLYIDNAGEEYIPYFFNELVNLLEKYEEIKRLKHVSQLGLKSLYTKSSIDNDRWEHSKKVAKIACKLYHRLCENSKKQESCFELVLLCTAALLHDCGHLPFSHLLEDVFEELSWGISENQDTFKHNQYSKFLVFHLYESTNSEFKNFLDKHGVTPKEVVLLIDGKYGIGYLDTLINSAVDADKIAYIFTDADQMERALMLKENEFIDKLTERAYITQEGLVALDSTSAWFALRLLDERKRMYEELYLDPKVRCMEAAAKYIITTYFVQKYNKTKFNELNPQFEEEGPSGLGGYRIMLSINDMIKMQDEENYQPENLSYSVGQRTIKSLKSCMEIVQKLKKSNNNKTLDEWILLKQMYRQLTNESWENEVQNNEILTPYQDDQIQEMATKLSYHKLADVRKRIILNYPGLVLIDLHRPIRYYSTPSSRKQRYRLDGTNCAQDTILLPDSKRSMWQDAGYIATIPLSEYVERYEKTTEQRPVFQVFKIGEDQADCEHAVNMLKKELQKQLSEKENNVK